VVLPFLAMQKVKLVCPHCGAEDTKLAAAVKKGVEVTCPACGRKHRVEHVERVIGTSGGRTR
jgi:transposase-like protein